MRNKEWYQFLGFLSTAPLWKENGIFELKQFPFPSTGFPEPLNFSIEIPGLETNYVLGKRIEDFYILLLQKSSRYTMLAQRLQIFKDKTTLGEMDFILEDLHEEKIIHLEVVYKFYIYDPSMDRELERWIGPNRRDTLLRKIHKLKSRQFPLLYKQETIQVLERLGIPAKPMEQQVSFLASLFIPRHSKQEDFPYVNKDGITGTWMNKDGITGTWMKMKDFTYADFGAQSFYLPLKQDWPIDPAYNRTWFSYHQILAQVQTSLLAQKSPLVWMQNNLGKFERFFIVYW